jgi:hypothetical protein
MPQPTSKTPTHKPAQVMPIIEGLSPETWKAALSRRPDGVSKADWSILTATLYEVNAGRVVKASQMSYAQKVAATANIPAGLQKKLADADLNRLTLEATSSGRQQIAAQPPLKFQRLDASGKQSPTSGPAVAAKPTAPAAHLQTASHAAPHDRPASTVAQHARPAPAGPTSTIKIPPGLAPDQATAYKHVVAALKSGNAKGISYGKLNFAHEIAKKANDADSGNAILRQMHALRPLAPGPGRFGVSDAEYANYARVESVVKGGVGGGQISEQNMVAAHKTALKYGHTEQADAIAAFLPAGAIAATAVAVHAAKKPPAHAAPAAHASRSASHSASAPSAPSALSPSALPLGPAPAGITAEEWKKAPQPAAGVPVPQWRTYLTVNYLLNNHGKISSVADLQTASGVSLKINKDPGEGMILHALAKGDEASVNTLTEARRLALAANHPKAARVIGERVIVAAHRSGKPADLKLAQTVAEEMGHHKTAAALAAKAAPVAAAAALATTAVAVAAPKTHQASTPPAAARPKTPAPAARTAARGYTDEDSKAVSEGMKKLDRYEKEALLNASDKLARKQPLTLKELTEGQAAADKAGLNVPAARFGKMASELHVKIALEQEQRLAGTRARIAARPTPPPPATVAKVPVTPPAATVAVQSGNLGVPPAKTAEVITAAKGGNKDAQKTIAQGAAVAQAAAAGQPAAQQQIATWQQQATQPSPEAPAAQKALTGVAAANSITAATAAVPRPTPQVQPEGEGVPLPPPLVSEAPRMRACAPPMQQARYTREAEQQMPEEAPPLPPPEHVAEVRTTPSTKLVKAAAVAAGVSAVAVGATIMAAKKGDQSAQNNMQSGAVLAEGLENNDPAAQATLSQLKTAAASGDSDAKAKLTGVAAAVATGKAIQEKAAKDKAAVLKEVRGEAIQASIAGPPSDSMVSAVLGSLALAGGGLFMWLKSKKAA